MTAADPLELADGQMLFDMPGPVPPRGGRVSNFPQRGMTGPHLPTSITDDWLTPPWLLARLGRFDVDPCASVDQPWRTADRQYTVFENGLMRRWEGRVWLNPPYGRAAAHWLGRLAAHGDGIALIFARTETSMFFEHVWYRADALLFFRGRLTFHRPDGEPGDYNGGAPSVLVAYGQRNAACLCGLDDIGCYIDLRAAS